MGSDGNAIQAIPLRDGSMQITPQRINALQWEALNGERKDDCMNLYVQTLIDGLLLGGVYASVAIGLSLCFGVMRVVNWAHGALLMMAMYLTYYLVSLAGIDVYLCCLITGAVMFVIGYLLQKFLFYRLIVREKEREPVNVLLFTSGLGMALTSLALILFGGFALQARTNYTGKSIYLGAYIISQTRLISFVIAIASTLALYVFLQKTETGRAMRATSQDRTVARLMGMNEKRIYCLAMGISQAMVGISASLLVSFYPVSNAVGQLFSFKSFIVVVLGGKGSILGCLLGGLLVGIIEKLFGTMFNESISQISLFALFVLILLFKPSGILGKEKE